MNCRFCDDEEIKSRMIYEDDRVMIFPTNIPITPGHTLVCPARHVAKLDELLDDEVQEIKGAIVRLKESLKKSLGAEGFNIAWNEGAAAGQSIDHLHIHVVPRKQGDEGVYEYEPRAFLYRPGSRETSPRQELEDIAALIKKDFAI